MDQQTYLKTLSYALRWRLPKPEADEVLADYEEMFSQCPADSDDQFIGELGGPFQAARLLTEPKAYRRWLAAFGLMAFCLLLPQCLLLRARFDQYPAGWMFLLLAAGTAAALFGLFGLVKARISDRRWRALYVMGLMVLSECVLVIAVLVSMDLGGASSGWWGSCAGSMGLIGLFGLAGTGVALC